jgi:hypothetical protein
MALQSVDRSVSCVVEARWFLAGNVGAGLLGGVDHDKERVDAYHFDSLSASASLKRRGRRSSFEEKWRVGAPTKLVLRGVVGQAEAWRKRRIRKGPKLRGTWIEVRKRIWVGPDWEICRLDVGGRRSWTVPLSLPGCWSHHGAAVLAPWWSVLRDDGVAASYPEWLVAISEELANHDHRAAG